MPPHLLLWLLPAATAVAALPPPDVQTARCVDALCAQLANVFPDHGSWHYEDLALAAYWLNERTAEADQALQAELKDSFPTEKSFHWHAYLLERIYFLSRKTAPFPRPHERHG